MLFRYRARNYPHTLDTREQQRWQDYKRDRFTLADGGASITLDNYMQRIAELMGSDDYDEKQQAMLAELKAYGELIANELAAYR
jgi:exodeoxyribonuclease-1